MRTIFPQTKKDELFPEQIGDYELISLLLESPRDDKKVGRPFSQTDLRFLYSNISIYEDIYSNCLTGSVTLVDASHLLTSFPIIGEETIEMGFRSLNTQIGILLRFRVIGISEIVAVNENTNVYTLQLISNVSILSEKQKVSRSFSRNTLSEIVEYICIKYLNMLDDNKVPVDTETDYKIKRKEKLANYYSIETESKHFEKFSAPYYSPLRIINKLCKRAVSESGSLFFFFQDINKFRFVSLEDIFKKRVSEKSIKRLVYIPRDTINKDTLAAWDVVIDFKIVSRFDVFKNMSRGMFSSEYVYVDMEKRNVITKPYYYQIDAPKQNHVNNENYLLTTNNSDLTHNENFESPRTVKDIVMIHAGDQESQDLSNHYAETLQRRLSIQSQIDSMVFEIVLPGDSSGQINVGDIVEFMYPKYDREDGDEYLSGKYMVTRIHHSIDKDLKYRLIIEMVSDTISKGYNIVNNDDSTNIGIQVDTKDIPLEFDKDLVGGSILSLLKLDSYYDEDRKFRLISTIRNT